MKTELIQSVSTVVPSKGHNAGRTMYVINGKHWSRTEPTKQDTHVCLVDSEEKDADGKPYLNVAGFSQDTRMDINTKFAMITKQDAAYSQALAMLLR